MLPAHSCQSATVTFDSLPVSIFVGDAIHRDGIRLLIHCRKEVYTLHVKGETPMSRRRNPTRLIIGLTAIICVIALFTTVTVFAQDGPEDPSSTSAETTLAGPNQAGGAINGPEALGPLATLTSWRVTGSALRPRESDVAYATNGSGGCTYATSGDAFTVWNVPVLLPNGATVNTLRMYYNDTSGSNSTAWFTIYDLYGNIVNEWSVSSSGAGGNSFNDSALINHKIDYSIYSYLINWRPIVIGSTMQVCGFRVFYEAPPFGATYLPAIRK
jgi:hypothetical protein